MNQVPTTSGAPGSTARSWTLLQGILGALILAVPFLSVFAGPVMASTVRTNPDYYMLSEDHTFVTANPGVLANDRGTGPLRVRRVNGPYHGQLRQSDGGGIKYFPNRNYHGRDSYTYRACEARQPLDCSKEIVHFTVRSVNDAPTAPTIGFSAVEDKTLTAPAPGVLKGARDVEGDKLTSTLSSAPVHGKATVAANGRATYRGDHNFNGRDLFVVRVTDSHGASTYRKVYVQVRPVNDAPTAPALKLKATEDKTLYFGVPGVLKGASDPDGDKITADTTVTPAHGKAIVNANGSGTYHPYRNYNGTDVLTVKVTDSHGASTSRKVYIAVNPVNDPPNAPDITRTATEDKTLLFGRPGVLAGASDPDGDKITARMVTKPNHGTATVNADGSGNYRGYHNFNGKDAITVKVTDSHGASTYRRVTLNVRSVNDVPTADNDRYFLRENEFREVEAPGLLKNDRDPDHDRLQVAHCSDNRHAAITCYPDGRVSIRPDRNYYGLLAFGYIVSDGHGGRDRATAYVHVMKR